MKRIVVMLIASIIWTYGNETLDALATRNGGQNEWDRVQASLQCEVRSNQVWCVVEGTWHTIDNQPLPVPWGL